MDQEYMELEDFDREYGLPDLFPVTLAEELLGDLGDPIQAVIFLPDGSIHYGPATAKRQPGVDVRTAGEIQKNGYARLPAAQGSMALFELIHELETIGYLALQGPGKQISDELLRTGRFIVKVIHRVVHLNYKNRLTAGLHGRVVEDSYAALKEKNSQLRQSEEKYRRLAENLEAEVACQTDEIKTAQMRLMQQEKLASVGQLAAGMAHEINNPIGFVISNLNSLRGYAADGGRLLRQYRGLKPLMDPVSGNENLLDKIRLELESIHETGNALDIDFVLEDMAALIAESLEGAERIKTIVHNLSEFARPSIETMESADIHQCLDTTLTLLSGQIGNNVHIEKVYSTIPAVRCRLREINQVFFHILRNALQAVGDQGEITIRTGTIDGGMVEVSIGDTGPGISETTLPHIFEPFFTTREVGAGTGLGLNLAYNLITRHEGTITVLSEEGSGSVFIIRMPISGPDAAAEAGNH